MKTDETAGHGERVDRVIIDDEELERLCAVVRVADELGAEILNELLELSVVEDGSSAAQLCDDAWMPRGVAVRSSNRVASGLPWRSERVSALVLLQS